MKNYGDLFIKDGKYIGEFEEMYKTFDDPWDQLKEGSFNNISRYSVAHFLKTYKIKSNVEFGCGLGKTMDFINSLTNINIIGVDISETCIKKAKILFPKMNFIVDTVENITDYSNYECFFFSEIAWMLLENNMIDGIFKKMSTHLKGKYFINNLNFYKGEQRYGLNYFSNLNEFINFCPFELLNKVEVDNPKYIETSSIYKIK